MYIKRYLHSLFIDNWNLTINENNLRVDADGFKKRFYGEILFIVFFINLKRYTRI